ncbi:unnamed protein product [Didymodactylos carnosus]|uniref:Uncharacterized protein n=1 Tax=Didymodactylos carnosus TaxID=1234261 RepID=A0A8S2DWJ6_9BILA|nr:unnamed protein product [Didymodactylos carnosus]CAF3820611.1 unnamed protein product [Didymodactylos carnosus]
MAYRRQTSKLCVRLTTQESDAINEQLRNYQLGVSDKLKHTVYMMVLAQNQFVEEYKQANNIRDFDYQDPNVEVLLELCDFEIERYDRFRQFRDNSIVYEDNTNDFLRNSYSKDELLYSIQKYIDGGRTKSRTDYKLYLKSIQKNPERVQFFKDKGLSDDEAFCCALTLSYYTG